MFRKEFDQRVLFHEVASTSGSVWLPLVTGTLIQHNGTRVALPLLFDTGASVTTLREDLYVLFGVSSWTDGVEQQVSTAGGQHLVPAYQYQGRLEVFGQIISCPINLQVLPRNPLYLGLLGREGVFNHFGFGFWESTHELFASLSP